MTSVATRGTARFAQFCRSVRRYPPLNGTSTFNPRTHRELSRATRSHCSARIEIAMRARVAPRWCSVFPALGWSHSLPVSGTKHVPDKRATAGRGERFGPRVFVCAATGPSGRRQRRGLVLGARGRRPSRPFGAADFFAMRRRRSSRVRNVSRVREEVASDGFDSRWHQR